MTTVFGNFFRVSLCAVVLSLTWGSLSHAQSTGQKFTTASGKTLVLVPLKSMGCPEMDKMLARIDATRYRENAPAPLNKADAPLYEYELVLAEENYNRCANVRQDVTGGLNILRRTKSK